MGIMLKAAGTGQNLVQNGYNDADGGDFEDQIDFHS